VTWEGFRYRRIVCQVRGLLMMQEDVPSGRSALLLHRWPSGNGVSMPAQAHFRITTILVLTPYSHELSEWTFAAPSAGFPAMRWRT